MFKALMSGSGKVQGSPVGKGERGLPLIAPPGMEDGNIFAKPQKQVKEKRVYLPRPIPKWRVVVLDPTSRRLRSLDIPTSRLHWVLSTGADRQASSEGGVIIGDTVVHVRKDPPQTEKEQDNSASERGVPVVPDGLIRGEGEGPRKSAEVNQLLEDACLWSPGTSGPAIPDP